MYNKLTEEGSRSSLLGVLNSFYEEDSLNYIYFYIYICIYPSTLCMIALYLVDWLVYIKIKFTTPLHF